MARSHLSSKLGIGVGILATVVADDDRAGGIDVAASRHGFFLEDTRRGIDDANQVIGREILPDNGAPAIGSEMNVSHGASLAMLRVNNAVLIIDDENGMSPEAGEDLLSQAGFIRHQEPIMRSGAQLLRFFWKGQAL